MKILGIDPGYERLGMAILERSEKQPLDDARGKQARSKINLIFSETFKTSVKDLHPKRLLEIQREIERVIKKYKPERLGVETLFFNKNVKTAIKVAEVRGIILATAQKYNLEIFEFSPQQIKISVTGYGKSDKTSVMKMIPLLVDLPKIKKEKKLDDEFDAISVAIATIHIRS